jgi:hypothetical protein
MKLRLLAASLLLSLAGVAKADTLPFVLTSITYQNSFTGLFPPGSLTGGILTLGTTFGGECISCVGGSGPTSTAIVDGNNVFLSNVAWSVAGTANSDPWQISFNGAVTIIANAVALVKDNVICTPGTAVSCSGIFSGYGSSIDLTGQGATGQACASCAVNVSISGTNVGDTLTIAIQKALSEANTASFQTYRLNYTLVPVPGAVWLFLSAIGGLAAFRRRALASA